MQMKSLFIAIFAVSAATAALADLDQPKPAIVDDGGSLKMTPSNSTPASNAGNTVNTGNSMTTGSSGIAPKIQNLDPALQATYDSLPQDLKDKFSMLQPDQQQAVLQQIKQMPPDQVQDVIRQLQGALSQVQPQTQTQPQTQPQTQMQKQPATITPPSAPASTTSSQDQYISGDSSDSSSSNNVSPGTASSTTSSADGDLMSPGSSQ